jgi:hypothetical protein
MVFVFRQFPAMLIHTLPHAHYGSQNAMSDPV